MQIELKEGQFAIVIDGNQTVKTRVYLGGKQVGILQGVEVRAHVGESTPHVKLDWGTNPVLATEPNLVATYQTYLDTLKNTAPWIAFSSPIGSSEPEVSSPLAEG